MAVEAFFFRESVSPLYGSYHAPRGGTVRSACVVLCQPYGHEYIRGHRAFKVLAERLAGAGFPTLRFDYRGCGDSGLDPEDVGLIDWCEDMRAATEMCRARSGRRKACAVGLRIGASLALLEAASKGTFDGLVLWDPVVSGKEYLAELESLHHNLLASLPGGAASAPRGEVAEYLGFPYADLLRSQLERLDLGIERAEKVARLLTISTGSEPEASPPLDIGAKSHDHRRVDDVRIWMEDADKALIPQQTLQELVEWLKAEYP